MEYWPPIGREPFPDTRKISLVIIHPVRPYDHPAFSLAAGLAPTCLTCQAVRVPVTRRTRVPAAPPGAAHVQSPGPGASSAGWGRSVETVSHLLL